jgi:tryptophan synthase alpha chain
MSKITDAFKDKKVFIGFVTAGDPSAQRTEELVIEMEKAGAGIVEIGIPFSDPVAEGLVIQRADERALAAGTTTDKIFEMVCRIRKKSAIPLAFMTYINPIFGYGAEKFFANCKSCAIDAVIVPDLPFEEKGEILPFCKKYGVALISLIAPTSSQRIGMIASEALGFVYCVSSLGVTGVRSEITTDIGQMISLVKAVRDIPCAIGFGISTPEQAKKMASIGDGVIVGSAIMKIVEQYGENCIGPVRDYDCRMKKAVSD